MNEATDFLSALDERIRQIARVVLAEGQRLAPAPETVLIDEGTRQAIAEQLLLAHKSYLTRKEAARYLNVSERSIAEWAARPAGENPFPESNAGGEPRTKREKIDEWTQRESQRRRLKLAG